MEIRSGPPPFADLRQILDDITADIRQPGLAGQSQLHARLEDLQTVLRDAHRAAPSLGAIERERARPILTHCQWRLRQTEEVLSKLRQWVEQRHTAGGGGESYGDAVGRGRAAAYGTKHSQGGSLDITLA